MSEGNEGNNPPAKPPITPPKREEPKQTNVKIDIDRSPEVEALRKDLEAKIRQLEDERNKEKTEREKLEKELNPIKDQLQQKSGLLTKIAAQQFADEKTGFIEQVKKDLGDEKAAELEERIGDDPMKLEEMKNTMAWLGDMLNKGKPPQAHPVGPDNPPPKSSVNIPPEMGGEGKTQLFNKEFNSTAEMVDYVRKAGNNPRSPDYEEAKKIYDQWWAKAIPQMRKDIRSTHLNLSQCVKCGVGMDGDTCWNCGWTKSGFEDKV